MPGEKSQPPAVPEVRTGQGDMKISKEVFRERLRERFYDPKFDGASAELDELIGIAWQVYSESHKSPRTRAAGEGFADPKMELSVQWLATRDAIAAAQREHDAPGARSRVLLICGSARNDQTCPGEMSKTYRLCSTARGVLSSVSDFDRRFSRPEPAHRGVRPHHLSVQSVRFHRDAAVSLAVFVLPEPLNRTGAGLDGRDLPALGRCARRS